MTDMVLDLNDENNQKNKEFDEDKINLFDTEENLIIQQQF